MYFPQIMIFYIFATQCNRLFNYAFCYIKSKFKILKAKRIEYILETNLLEKKCKTAILLYCFHTAGVLHIFMLYNLLGPGISFYRKSKINIKRKPNYEIGWFHNCPMIISHRLYAFHFTNDMIFRYNYKSNDVFYSPNSFKSLFNSFKIFEIEMDSLGNILY